MKIIFGVLFLLFAGCTHAKHRAPSSSEEAVLRDKVESVIRAVVEKNFDVDSTENTLHPMLIFNPKKHTSGVAYVGDIYLASKKTTCEANFFIYEATDKEPGSCSFQVICPMMPSAYRKLGPCP